MHISKLADLSPFLSPTSKVILILKHTCHCAEARNHHRDASNCGFGILKLTGVFVAADIFCCSLYRLWYLLLACFLNFLKALFSEDMDK